MSGRTTLRLAPLSWLAVLALSAPAFAQPATVGEQARTSRDESFLKMQRARPADADRDKRSAKPERGPFKIEIEERRRDAKGGGGATASPGVAKQPQGATFGERASGGAGAAAQPADNAKAAAPSLTIKTKSPR